jgi:hypothetical protein
MRELTGTRPPTGFVRGLSGESGRPEALSDGT